LMVSSISAEEPTGVVEVNAQRLNLRAGEGTNYPIIKTLKIGDKLVVLNEKMEWVQVRLPGNIACWVTKKYVEVTDKEKNIGVVKTAKLNVRSQSDNGDNIIGNLKEGQTVQIKIEKGEWYQIAPTDNLTGWVNKKYTKYWGTYERYMDEQNKILQSEKFKQELLDKFEQAEKMYDEEKVKPLQQKNYSEILGLYKEIIAKTTDKDLIDKCDARIKQIEPLHEAVEQFKKAITERDAKIEEIEAVAIKELEKLYRQQNPVPAFIAMGWVEGEGKYIGRPAAYILTMGGKTLYFLKSANINLDDFYGQYVGVKGTIIENKGWQAKTIKVDKIEIIAEEGAQ